MNEANADYSDLMAILRGMLGQTLQDQAASSDPPSSEDLFDLVEGRLTATEREDLLERIAAHPDSQAELADLLTGIELAESLTETVASKSSQAVSVLDSIRSWLTPRVMVPALSLCLLVILTVPYLIGPPGQIGGPHEGKLPSEGGYRTIPPDMFAPEPGTYATVVEDIESATAEVLSGTAEIQSATAEVLSATTTIRGETDGNGQP